MSLFCCFMASGASSLCALIGKLVQGLIVLNLKSRSNLQANFVSFHWPIISVQNPSSFQFNWHSLLLISRFVFVGALHLAGPIAKISKGLCKLRLGHCGLTSKGVNQIAHSLSLNQSISSSLTHLDLSGNNLKDDINVSWQLLEIFFDFL